MDNGHDSLKGLFEASIVSLAKKPLKNEFDISTIDSLDAYTVPLIAHDYGAKTPIMWNTVYEALGLNIRNLMVVADPARLKEITAVFRRDPKYVGGGAGVGFKEKIVDYLDRTVPNGLRSVNIVVKEGAELVGYNTDAKGLLLSIKDELSKVKKDVKGSNYVIFGAGGVAKPFTELLASESARRIAIINRTISKATALAYDLQSRFKDIEVYSAPEDMIRGTILNTIVKPDVIVNCTDKGADGPLLDVSPFAAGTAGEFNNTLSLENCRNLKNLNSDVVIVDIVLPARGADNSIMLSHARDAKLEHLVNGLGMVINQAAPAYKLVEKSHQDVHRKTLPEDEIRKLMQRAARSA